MKSSQQPSKERVREYMEQRQREHKPPPSLKDIRKQLGWDLIDASRQANEILALHSWPA